MDLTDDLMSNQAQKANFRGDVEIKRRFRILLREGMEIATRNGHNIRVDKIKLEDTHMWGSLVCKNCGGILYLDADRKWHKDKIFGMAAIINCKKKKTG